MEGVSRRRFATNAVAFVAVVGLSSMGCGEVECDCAPPRAALLVELKRPAPGTVTVCRGDVCESAPINGTDGSADEADITVDELGSVSDL
ncbi:MAG TPA: hypothetical protein VK988_18855, partial [Acidimicrobiales bacterium]|nr:hypothetical protein [Acidimicrobiales bacterium]